MQFRIFQGTMISWHDLFADAARFATELGPAGVHRISHSACNGRGIVVVWHEEREPQAAPGVPLELRVKFERGTMISWKELFQLAADHAAKLAPEQLVSISHSDDSSNGVVAVWYWDVRRDAEKPKPPPAAPDSPDSPDSAGG